MLTLASELLAENSTSGMAASDTSFSTWISWLRVKVACLKDDPGTWDRDGRSTGDVRGGTWGRVRMVFMFTNYHCITDGVG